MALCTFALVPHTFAGGFTDLLRIIFSTGATAGAPWFFFTGDRKALGLFVFSSAGMNCINIATNSTVQKAVSDFDAFLQTPEGQRMHTKIMQALADSVKLNDAEAAGTLLDFFDEEYVESQTTAAPATTTQEMMAEIQRSGGSWPF